MEGIYFASSILTPSGFANSLASKGTSSAILSETRGLWLCWVSRGGIGLTRRLGAERQHTERLMSVLILSLEPEHRTNRWANTEA
jgi:hypothetical protein